MAEELQNLLEKIKRDGVEKAKAEAAAILAQAKAEAEKTVREAEEKAAAAKAAAESAAEAYAARAKETVSQAARDTVLAVGQAVTAMLEKTLAENVGTALADPQSAAAIAGDAIRAIVKEGAEAEIAVSSPKLAESLRAQLAAQKNLKVVLDETAATGFSVRLENGRVEHDFTGPAVAAELARRLRPDLAKIMSAAAD